MGVSITRIVKFIRKGKGVIIAQSPTVWSYTETQWKNYYCTNGRSLTWKPISNVSDFTVGDTMVINGVVSDKGNITISLYAKVVSIDVANQSITAQSQNYIISGEDGKDAVSIYVDPPTIVHKKATTKTTYSIDFKVKDGANYVTGVSTNSVFTCSLQTTLPSGISYSYKVLQNDRISCVFVVDANAVVNVDLSFKVTYKGIDYNCTVPFKTVADGQTGGKGDRGPALRGPQMWDDCAVGYVFQQGADGEDFKDVVMYNNNYYSCIMTHAKETGETTSDGTLTAKYWKLADKFEIIATKILLAELSFIENLGVDNIIITSQGKGKGDILLKADKNGIVCNSGTFKNGTFTNVKVIGSLRNPYSLAKGSFDVDYSDNVAMISNGGGWIDAYSMPWDVSQNGRKISIVNYRWGDTYAQGQAGISAPSGKYFFEDGIQKSELKVSREIIELIGYGTSSEFYGWIVLNRIDLMTSQKYGHCLKALAFGTVTGTNKTASISYKTFDGRTMGVSRLNTGVYKVTFPTSWFGNANNCRVILTGRGYAYNESSPCKASLASVNSGNITVDTSDDSSRNDGSFDFIIYNGSDFDIL